MSDNDDKVTLTIDGREVTVAKGTTVLEAAKLLGIDIPHFCWHPKLKPAGACRICYVEIEKMPKLMVSCATPVAPGMVVHTDTEKVKQGRKAVLEFILINHPLDCPTCDKGGECDLQDLTFAHGIDESRFDFKKYRHIRDKNSTFDDLRLGPEIIRNQNRCILCYKCVRANKEIFGEYDLGAFQRGNITEINAAPGRQVDSIYSGNLVEICPVGALTNTDWRYKIRVWKTQTVDSVCPYCADGCNIKLWKDRQKIYRATSRRNDAIDEGWICDIGRYGYQIVNTEGRLATPLIKKGDSQVPSTWEEALGLIARKFKDIKDKRGGVCIGGMISPQTDCASMYAFSKFLRTVINSNNIDFRTDYKMLPEESGDMYTRMTSSNFNIADIEKSDVVIIIGSDLINEHPITNLRVRKAVTQKGARLYTINPFGTKTGGLSTDEMIYNIGTLEALLNGVCVSIIDQGMAKAETDISDFKSKVAPNTVDEASRISGIEAERINSLARVLGSAGHISIIGGELLTSSVAREKIAGAVNNLAVLSEAVRNGQTGILSKAANSKGGEKLGIMPHLPDKMILQLKQFWNQFPEAEGLAADRMIRAACKEELDSLFVIGCNPMLHYPDGAYVKEGLEKLDFLVVADMFETETTQVADVVLPLSSWAEYNGQFVNLEGMVQDFRAAIKPIGQSQPGYALISRVAAEMKSPLFESDEQLLSEVKSVLNFDGTVEPGRGIIEVKYSKDKINPDFPTPLIIADELHHFGYLTEKTGSLSAFCGEAFLEISPAAAEKLGVENGSIIRIESEVGKINLPVRVSAHIDNDVAVAYRNFSASPVNILQMRKRRVDRVKLTAVEGA